MSKSIIEYLRGSDERREFRRCMYHCLQGCEGLQWEDEMSWCECALACRAECSDGNVVVIEGDDYIIIVVRK